MSLWTPGIIWMLNVTLITNLPQTWLYLRKATYYKNINVILHGSIHKVLLQIIAINIIRLIVV